MAKHTDTSHVAASARHPHKPEELYVNIAAAQKAAEGEGADGSAE